MVVSLQERERHIDICKIIDWHDLYTDAAIWFLHVPNNAAGAKFYSSEVIHLIVNI